MPEVRTQSVRFHHLNRELGISIRETNGICSDYNGFIWASSKMGVIRLTEEDYKIYQLPYESTDVISVRLACRDNQLYCYTNNGQIFIYDRVKDLFRLVVNIALEINNQYLGVNGLLADGNGRLFIASTDGLFIYENGQLLKDEIFSFYIEQIAWHSDEILWVVNFSGIYKYNLSNAATDTVYLKSPRDNFQVSSIYYDQPFKKLWLGTLSAGSCVLQESHMAASLRFVEDLPVQPVLAIELVNDSTVMLGIDGQGIWAVDRETNILTGSYKEDADDPGSLQGNGVYDICRDNNNKVWVSTFSDGISYFDQGMHEIKQFTHQINNLNSLVNNNVNAVLEDKSGKLWFATNNGLSSYNPATEKWFAVNQNMKVGAQVFTTLCEDNAGNIWAGTYSSGIYLFDHHNGRELNHYEMSSEGTRGLSNFVFSIYKDSEGDIWIGGVQGNLVCFSYKERQFRPYPFLPVNVLEEYRPGKMLAGCTFGLVQVDKSTGETENLLEGYLIHDILVDGDEIWLCTSGNGLIRFNPVNKEVKKYTTDQGLLSNYVNSAVLKGNFIWLGTEQGLCRLDVNSGNVAVFPAEPTLIGSAFNSNAHFLLQNGMLLLGSNNGAFLFDPELIENSHPKGKMYFQDVIISGTSWRELADSLQSSPLDSLRRLSLNYNQNTLGIELLAIGSSAKGAKFSWKLEGLDKGWNQPGSVRTISYANLPSGDFVLKIRMHDSSLSQVIEERELVIEITPPFWDTWWFKLGAGFFLAGLLAFVLLQYVNRLKKQHSDQKIRFFTGVAHDIRTAVTLINSPVEELNKETKLSEHGRYYLNLALEQSRRLSKVVTQLMDFQKVDIGREELSLAMVDIVLLIQKRIQMFQPLALNKQVTLHFTTNQSAFIAAVDEAKAEKIVDNLISNAVKYSKETGRVDVELHVSESRWVLKVKDQGIGISRKSQRKLFREFYRGENAVNSKIVGSGIGLVLAKKYVSMHKGRISCVSQENEGTVIQIVIPCRRVEQTGIKAGEADAEVAGIALNQSFQPPVVKEEEKAVKKKKLLIAEDNDSLRSFLITSLGAEFQVSGCANGDDAWEVVLKEMPDLVVSDIMMPGLDGYELCKIIKSTYDTSHIPVILLTSLAGKAEELHGLGTGADDYLTKPFDVALLLQRIKNILKNRELIRDKALKFIHGAKDEVVFSNELNDKFVKKMVEVVKTNIANPEFNKELFASEMNVSPSLLYKKSKALTDQSPTDFIKAIRMDHALRLLRENRYSITEISIICGFSSIGYFSTVFKNYYGRSPSEMGL